MRAWCAQTENRWRLHWVKVLPPAVEYLRNSEVVQRDDGLLAIVMTWLIKTMRWLLRVVIKVIARAVGKA